MGTFLHGGRVWLQTPSFADATFLGVHTVRVVLSRAWMLVRTALCNAWLNAVGGVAATGLLLWLGHAFVLQPDCMVAGRGCGCRCGHPAANHRGHAMQSTLCACVSWCVSLVGTAFGALPGWFWVGFYLCGHSAVAGLAA